MTEVTTVPGDPIDNHLRALRLLGNPALNEEPGAVMSYLYKGAAPYIQLERLDSDINVEPTRIIRYLITPECLAILESQGWLDQDDGLRFPIERWVISSKGRDVLAKLT